MKKFLIFFSLLFVFNVEKVKANNIAKLDELNNKFITCTKKLETYEQKCPEKWKYKCYNILMNANNETQKCYIDIAKELYLIYYKQDYISTQKMFEEIADLAYKKHLFIYQENNYCKNNNCGTSTYLRSQYATTQTIKDYLDKTFITIKNYLE